MAGSLPYSRRSFRRASWPRDLQRAALFLGAAGGLYWSSFGMGRLVLWVPGLGSLFLDLLVAWIAILLQVAAWPSLWAGLRDLRARRPRETSPVLAWRAFLLTLALAFSAILLLPLQYHTYASTEAWLLVLYVTVFPYLAWTFVPILALHGILFGRVANYLDRTSRHIIDLGASTLFAVAVATTAVVLQHPGVSAFTSSWAVGRGLLPAAAFAGYALISVGMTIHLAPGASRLAARAGFHVR